MRPEYNSRVESSEILKFAIAFCQADQKHALRINSAHLLFAMCRRASILSDDAVNMVIREVVNVLNSVDPVWRKL